MVEYCPISFFFNQDEYEVSVIFGHAVKCFFRLPDGKGTIVTITLDDQYGIGKIETVTEDQIAEYQIRKDAEKVDISDARKVEGSSQFHSGYPPVPNYEVKLNNGSIVQAEPRLYTGSSIQWIQRYTEKFIPHTDIKGWRIKKS
ncbi:MAG: hypothetical protein Q8R30_03060 [bacterium]|nr:hypothetical protein [bacterium]